MEEIVQERLISIEYEALDQQTGFDLHNSLHAFLIGGTVAGWALEKRFSSPMVVMPSESLQSDEPDWSRMQMFVDRRYRYRSSSQNLIIQFCKDFMTINAVGNKQTGVRCPLFGELRSAFDELLPFVSEELIKKVCLKDIRYEVVYRIDEKDMEHLLSSRYQAGKKDYLDVFGLLRSFASGVNNGDWELDVPLRQELIYHIKDDPDKKRLWENVIVGHRPREGWSAIMQLRAYSERIHEMSSSEDRMSAFMQLLPKYDEMQREGLRRLLTDEMYNRFSGGST